VTWAGLAPGWVGLYQVNVAGGRRYTGWPAAHRGLVRGRFFPAECHSHGERFRHHTDGSVDLSGRWRGFLWRCTTHYSGRNRRFEYSGAHLQNYRPCRVPTRGSDVYVVRGLPRSLTTPCGLRFPFNPGVDPAKTLVVTRQLWGVRAISRRRMQRQLPPTHSDPSSFAGRGIRRHHHLAARARGSRRPSDTEIETFVLQNYGSALCPGGSDLSPLLPNSAPGVNRPL